MFRKRWSTLTAPPFHLGATDEARPEAAYVRYAWGAVRDGRTARETDEALAPLIRRKYRPSASLPHPPFESRRQAFEKSVVVWSSAAQNSSYINNLVCGGEGGIRTPGTLARTPHFECGAIDHSATSPRPSAKRGNVRLRGRAGDYHDQPRPARRPAGGGVSRPAFHLVHRKLRHQRHGCAHLARPLGI